MISFKENPRVIVAGIFIILAVLSISRIIKFSSNYNQRKVIGTEYSWIAENIASGHGYSFTSNTRWLFYDFKTKSSLKKYSPTAWEEPIYTYVIAFSQKYFSNNGALVIVVLHILALFLTSVVLYYLIKKIFNTDIGIVASIFLLLFWPDVRSLTESIFSPAIFAGLFFTSTAYLFLWFLDRISILRGIIVGIALGVSCMTLAANLLFVPIVIFYTLYYSYNLKSAAWKETLAIIITFIMIIMPWTIRNYLVFGELITFRNGVGQGLHMSNNIVAATFSDGNFACEDSLGSLWKAENANEALKMISNDREKRIAVYKRAHDCIQIEAPKNYDTFNEAQRDKFYLKKAISFIKANPGTFLTLTYYRLKLFLVGWNKMHALIAVLAILGAIFSFRNKKCIPLILMALGYILTFSLIGAWFYRYRYPIEPILILLSFCFFISVFKVLKEKFAFLKNNKN